MDQIKSWKKSTHNTELLFPFFAVKLALILIINSKISPDQCHFCNLFISMTVYTKLTLRSITPCDSHGMSKCKRYQRDSSINIDASLIIIIITTINIVVIKSCKTKKTKTHQEHCLQDTCISHPPPVRLDIWYIHIHPA